MLKKVSFETAHTENLDGVNAKSNVGFSVQITLILREVWNDSIGELISDALLVLHVSKLNEKERSCVLDLLTATLELVNHHASESFIYFKGIEFL